MTRISRRIAQLPIYYKRKKKRKKKVRSLYLYITIFLMCLSYSPWPINRGGGAFHFLEIFGGREFLIILIRLPPVAFSKISEGGGPLLGPPH